MKFEQPTISFSGNSRALRPQGAVNDAHSFLSVTAFTYPTEEPVFHFTAFEDVTPSAAVASLVLTRPQMSALVALLEVALRSTDRNEAGRDLEADAEAARTQPHAA